VINALTNTTDLSTFDRDTFCFSGFTARELIITASPDVDFGTSNVKLGIEVRRGERKGGRRGCKGN
jgi:hypothetical protein